MPDPVSTTLVFTRRTSIFGKTKGAIAMTIHEASSGAKPCSMPALVPVAGMKWREPSLNQKWYDGTQILAAVLVRDSRWDKTYWEYSVVTINADDGRFDLECNGDPWGWDYASIQWFILLDGQVVDESEGA